ncbi:MAG: transglycosylase domain-containing protein, partial [Verrucomicrobiota bacterium]
MNQDLLEPESALEESPPSRAREWWKKAQWTFYGVALLFFVSFIFLARSVKPYYDAVQKYDLVHLSDLPISTILLDRNQDVMGYLYTENHVTLESAEIPKLIRDAFVAAEDRRFYDHRGVDFRGVLRAASINMKRQRIVQGGSTITQQLAKQIIGDSRRTWNRKWKEIFLARRLEKTFSKDEVLTYYLNRVYFGSGYFGLAAASQGYFGKKPMELSIAEAAILAGIVRAPRSYSPTRYYENSLRRSALILGIMEELQFITLFEKKMALEERPPVHQTSLAGTNNHYRIRLMMEIEQILELKHREQLPQGLRIYTTLDADLQNQTEKLLREES